MSGRKRNAIFLWAELSVCVVCAVAFVLLGVFGNVPAWAVNAIYMAFIAGWFGYLLVLEFFFPKYDNAVHFKAFAKYYRPTGRAPRASYRRKGIGMVIALWIAYLAAIGLLKAIGVLNWYVFLLGACLMFALNSIFVHKVCLLSVLFLHNENHCCKNCGINSWDYAIFASALLFAPRLSLAATVLNGAILLCAVVMLVIWEIQYRKHPYRFYPQTNQALGCGGCMKQCKYAASEKQR